MSNTRFDASIDASWAESGGDWGIHEKILRRELEDWPVADLTSYVVTQRHRRRRAFKPEVYNAAFMVWDGALGMDGFLDFTDALSVIPRNDFEMIIANPDHILEIPALWSPSEPCFWIIPFQIFDKQKQAEDGTHLLDAHLPPDEITSATLWAPLKGSISRDNSARLLPKLYSRFGHSAFTGR